MIHKVLSAAIALVSLAALMQAGRNRAPQYPRNEYHTPDACSNYLKTCTAATRNELKERLDTIRNILRARAESDSEEAAAIIQLLVEYEILPTQ